MKVLKIISEAVTASFRYPYVQIGRLPTFEVPPPATIYGHLAGVVGEWFDPEGAEFAYTFLHQGRVADLETAQPIEQGFGRKTYARRGWSYPVNVHCAPNPQRREFLVRPRLSLFVKANNPLLERLRISFHNPAYAYVMGRSQDLATCLSADIVDLDESEEAFFSHTILPYEWRPWVLPGTTVQMPKSINYYRRRESVFERYLQILWPPLKLYSGSQDTISRDHLPVRFAVDENDRQEFAGKVLSRGLFFHPVIGPGAPM